MKSKQRDEFSNSEVLVIGINTPVSLLLDICYEVEDISMSAKVNHCP